MTFTGKEERNKETIQAQSYDRTFILSGPVIKVYQTAEESGLGFVSDQLKISHVTDLPIVKTAKGDIVQPSNLLLHDSEGQLVFKNEVDPSQLYIYDLETGKVLQELDTAGINFNSIANDTKNGQKEAGRTLLGVETQGMHQLDPRCSGNSIVSSKTYKTNVLFNTISPTLTGGFAVGSANGDIRMYKQMGQVAKTYLPGLGEAIKSIDISQDQKWMLATCQTFLLVLPTTNDGTSGFEKSISKSKPQPFKLTVDPKDIVKHQIKGVNFTPARFNNGDSIHESSIVTSTGKFLVTWNFDKVKKGNLRGGYKLKNLHQAAVDG